MLLKEELEVRLKKIQKKVFKRNYWCAKKPMIIKMNLRMLKVKLRGSMQLMKYSNYFKIKNLLLV